MKNSQIKNTKQQQITRFLPAAFFVIAFVYFFVFGSHILFFQEQQSLFVYSPFFLHDFLVRPGGLLELAGEFLTQFYISRLAGSMILAAILVLPALILAMVNKRLIHGAILTDLLNLVPSCLLLILQTHYYHVMVYNLGYVIVLAWFMVFITTDNKTLKYTITGLFPLLMYITGAYSMLFMVLFIMYCLIFIKGKEKFYYMALIIAAAAISVFLFRHLLLVQSYRQFVLYPFPFINDSTHQAGFYILTSFIALYPMIAILSARFKPVRIKTRTIVSSASVVLLYILTVFMLVKEYSPQNVRVINLQKLVYEERWNEAVEYHEKQPSENLIGQFFYNIALSETNQLCSRIFAGRQDFGTSSLILEWSSDHINWGSHAFYTVGLINEAHRWAYEEMVVYGQRPQNMKMLVKTSLLTGNYRMAGKYTGILRKTMFYRSWAREYEKMVSDTSLVRKHPDLGNRLKVVAKGDFFMHLESPEANLPILVDENPRNKRAFEYLMAWLLFGKNVDILVNNIHLMKNMGYTSIPRHIEEAILIYYNSQRKFPEMGGLAISNETRARFDQYFSSFVVARQNPATLQDKMKPFSNTFWYYYHFR